jgi:hypothetical protein
MFERARASDSMASTFIARPVLQRNAARPSTASLFRRASLEPAHALDSSVSGPLSRGLGHDFSHVRVHSGPASARAAEQIGARAYTLGRDVHLGTEVPSLSPGERHGLLAHEAVHTLQQGRRDVAPHDGLPVSRPGDRAEIEASTIASLVARGHAHALAREHRGLQSVTPRIQRDLSGKYPVNEGDFTLKLKTESHPNAKSGLSGTIKFRPKETAPDSKNIRLMQVAKTTDAATGTDYVWTGDEANRNKTMTRDDKKRGLEGGHFIDRVYKNLHARAHKTDQRVSPYYIDDYKSEHLPYNADGHKHGKDIGEASLGDYPGSDGNTAFSFETIAKAADTGHVYGTVMWGFVISDAAHGKVDKERAVGRNVTLLNSDVALKNYDTFFKNQGTPRAP